MEGEWSIDTYRDQFAKERMKRCGIMLGVLQVLRDSGIGSQGLVVNRQWTQGRGWKTMEQLNTCLDVSEANRCG